MRLAQLTRRFRDRIDAVEATLHGSLDGTREGYRTWLCDLAGFVVPFEVRFAFAHGLELSFIERRIKAGRIADDLLALGLSSTDYARLARRCTVPDFAAIEALGWLTVVDGIVLGFGALHPRIAPRDLAIAGSFLRSYGTTAEQRWIELSHAISVRVVDDVAMQRLYAATAAALDCFEQHLAENAMPSSVQIHVAG